MKVFLRLAVMLVVSVLTWYATKSILAQQRGKTTPKPVAASVSPEQGKMTSVIRKINKADFAARQEIKIGDEPPLASWTLNRYGVDVIDGMAAVSAEATLTESGKRLGFYSYMWRLRIVDSQGKVSSDGWYEDQVFDVGGEGLRQPTFNDLVALPPGQDTLVQLSLYAFPKNLDRVLLKDDANNRGYRVLRGVKKVTN